MAPTTLAERVSYLCKHSGVESRERLSGLCGLSSAHLGLFARGKYPAMTTTVASKIASTFACSLDWLIDGKEPKPKPADIHAAVAKSFKSQGKSPGPKAA
ncbi:MAG: XRE family transcriptional regulator [Proteobacteria bacterium]|nr:MAG: XRE family transcriptional regulator [Pseudomonadota bacterium]